MRFNIFFDVVYRGSWQAAGVSFIYLKVNVKV